MSVQNRIKRTARSIVPTRLDGDSVPAWNELSYPQRERLNEILIRINVIVFALVFVFPLYWMLVTSLRSPESFYNIPISLFPTTITLEHYANILSGKYVRWYLNSAITAIGVVTLSVTISTLGGYGLSRLEIPFKKYFARGILFGYMFPPILLAIPMFIFWRELGLINSLVGLIIAESALAMPFSLWMMWQVFQTVPYSLEEAAHMSGATRFRAFYDVALPLAKPGMLAVGIFSFAVAWNQFTIPQVLMKQETAWVIVQGLFSFSKQSQVLWGQLMAASVIALVPPFLFVFYLQKYLLRGFRIGSIG